MSKSLAKGVFGFTLVELMVVVGIIAILVALSLPNYMQFIRKSNRGEAQQLMMNYANMQEIWRANHPAYAVAADIGVPLHDKYTFTITIIPETAAFAYLITADPIGDQAYDKDRGKSCDPLAFNQSGDKGVLKSNGTIDKICWGN